MTRLKTKIVHEHVGGRMRYTSPLFLVGGMVGCADDEIPLAGADECGTVYEGNLEPDETSALGFSADEVVTWFGSRSASVAWHELEGTSAEDPAVSTVSTPPSLPVLDVSVALEADAAVGAGHIVVLSDESDDPGCSPYESWLDIARVPGTVSVLGSLLAGNLAFEAASIGEPALVDVQFSLSALEPLGTDSDYLAPVLPAGAALTEAALGIGGSWEPEPAELGASLFVTYSMDGVTTSGWLLLTGTAMTE